MIPPQDLEAERAVLSSLLLAGSEGNRKAKAVTDALALLRPEHFYSSRHAVIFTAITALHAAGKPFDSVSVAADLERRGKLVEAGGQEAVHLLASTAGAIGNATHHARRVWEKARDRDALRELWPLSEKVRDGTADADDVLRRITKVRDLYRAAGRTSRVKTFDEVLAAYAEERSGPDLEPVRLGLGTIDAELRGVSAGQVCGIAARTAVGKTWALNSVADSFANREDAGMLILSLEMPAPEWAERQLAIHANIRPEEVEEAARQGDLGSLAAPFLERMQNARIADEPLGLGDLPSVLADARARLDVPLRLVLIDYLGLLNAEGNGAYERASALGKGLKQLAKAESIAVVVAMQITRAGGDGSEPVTLSMLRDSGVLEESLDFLLGAWRPGKAKNLLPDEEADLADVMRVAILKNRKGRDGRVVDLRFHAHSRRVYEEAA